MRNYKKRSFKKRPVRRFKKRAARKTYAKKGNFVKQRFHQVISVIALASATNFTVAYSPSLGNISANDLQGYTLLYDEYKITKCGIMLVPNFSQSDPLIPAPNIYSVVDKNDSNTLALINDALEYNNCKRTAGDKKHFRSWVPSVTTILSDVNGTQFRQENKPQWVQLDTSTQHNADIANLGVKFISDTNNGPNTLQYTVHLYMDVLFRTKL